MGGGDGESALGDGYSVVEDVAFGVGFFVLDVLDGDLDGEGVFAGECADVLGDLHHVEAEGGVVVGLRPYGVVLVEQFEAVEVGVVLNRRVRLEHDLHVDVFGQSHFSLEDEVRYVYSFDVLQVVVGVVVV